MRYQIITLWRWTFVMANGKFQYVPAGQESTVNAFDLSNKRLRMTIAGRFWQTREKQHQPLRAWGRQTSSRQNSPIVVRARRWDKTVATKIVTCPCEDEIGELGYRYP
jgi:glyoxylate utilization-related uncharacterized protein